MIASKTFNTKVTITDTQFARDYVDQGQHPCFTSFPAARIQWTGLVGATACGAALSY